MARDLGEDLESEILVRLPAKSLMRFKCVQRSWNALFRNHRFVMSHMNMHMSKEHLMVFQFKRNIHASLTCDDPSKPPQYFNCSSPNKTFYFLRSYGSCNGVFCLGVNYKESYCNRLILWNPNTRESKLIPFPSNKFSYAFQGFGVDPNTNDFKIIKPIINILDWRHLFISHAEVYNLSTNSWTVIHDVTLPTTNNALFQLANGSNVLVNGVYYWLIGYEDGFGSILCFDFRNNQFSKLMAPVDISNIETLLVQDNTVEDNIFEVNGSLGYIVQCHGQNRLEIWIMNEHKWTKTHNTVWPKEILILGIWKDGNQLLGRKGYLGKQWLTIYNLGAQPVHQFPVGVYLDSPIEKYVESIVPLSA
ncbi:putative F-box/kelch-repeat protein At3g17570 [Gastrolobium bilobum]|uniref:putative F-box/kelch-repeat protein At3g17570 n=1 Tax=Gastrolobium bilobum TaxID=150636 RepID=UPI002AB08F8D|nr:putative F-box/kelch-repeat protein At3g17570 [Gastrolobium bilobum]